MSWGKILKQCYLYAAKQTGESVQNFPVVPMTRDACENSCASKGTEEVGEERQMRKCF